MTKAWVKSSGFNNSFIDKSNHIAVKRQLAAHLMNVKNKKRACSVCSPFERLLRYLMLPSKQDGTVEQGKSHQRKLR